MTLDLGRSEFINGISGGIIGAFSAATFFSIQRNDIKKFILDSNNRGYKLSRENAYGLVRFVRDHC